MTTHNPPDLIGSDNPNDKQGWSRVSELISVRWPSWEPTPQDLRDWRHLLRNFDSTWLDEALLHVRSRYASDIPKLKWVLDAYYKVRDQQRQVKAPDLEEEKAVAEQMMRQQAVNDKRECMAFLGSQSQQVLLEARDNTGRKFPFLTPSESSDYNNWSWLTKFAVMFLLEDSPNV
jgi:hypothetical protein